MHHQQHTDLLKKPLWLCDDLTAFFVVSTPTIYRWLKTNPDFPKQIHLNPSKKNSAVRWRLEDILAYLNGPAANDSHTNSEKE